MKIHFHQFFSTLLRRELLRNLIFVTVLRLLNFVQFSNFLKPTPSPLTHTPDHLNHPHPLNRSPQQPHPAPPPPPPEPRALPSAPRALRWGGGGVCSGVICVFNLIFRTCFCISSYVFNVFSKKKQNKKSEKKSF